VWKIDEKFYISLLFGSVLVYVYFFLDAYRGYRSCTNGICFVTGKMV